MTREQIDKTIEHLSKHQGSYRQLRETLAASTEDERSKFYSRFALCSSPVDFVIAHELG